MTLLNEDPQDEGSNVAEAAINTRLSIPITKASTKTKVQSIEIETRDIPVDMYMLALQEGLKVLLNSRQSKITGVTKLEGIELAKAQAEAMRIANENYEKVMAGTFKKGGRAGTEKTTVPREVMAEAVRLAKVVVNNEIRSAGIRPALVKEKDKTDIAKEMVAADPQWIEQAKLRLEELATTPVKADIRSRIKADPTLVAKDEKKKADRKASGLSAKQAGMTGKVPPRRPQPYAGATH